MGADRPGGYRRLAWRLMPVLMTVYVLVQISRFNIGFARLQFMDDLGVGEATFGMAASAFYVGYILFQVPTSLVFARFGFRATLATMAVGWGVAGALLAAARDGGDLVAVRLLLGAAQGGFFPTMIFYLACQFPDRLRARINTLFTAALPIGGMIGGPLAAALLGGLDGVLGMRGWQWLFLLEGLAAAGIAIAAAAILPDLKPSAATSGPRPAAIPAAALRDPVPWLLGAIYFGYFCALNALLVWQPTLLKLAGASNLWTIGLVSGLSALASLVGLLVVGASSDRRGERHRHVAACGGVGAACFLALPLASGSVAATAALFVLLSASLYPIIGIFWAIPRRSPGAASGFAIINSLGVCGGIASPMLVGFLHQWTGSLYWGTSAVALLLAAAMAALLVLRPGR